MRSQLISTKRIDNQAAFWQLAVSVAFANSFPSLYDVTSNFASCHPSGLNVVLRKSICPVASCVYSQQRIYIAYIYEFHSHKTQLI